MKSILLSILLTFSLTAFGQGFNNGYNFNLPWDDGSVQEYLPHFEANPISDRVVSVGDQFMVNGRPIKFWGVNLTTEACFPEKNIAPQIATRMRKMGINLVRFHHMDNSWEGNIFDESNNTTRVLDTEMLDRLFFFINELKNNNIYSNINLNVSRTFTVNDGVIAADSLDAFGKGISLFDPKMIELQKEFAQQLLKEVNPYSGMALADDPAVAVVEIANENTLYGAWTDNSLLRIDEGGTFPVKYTTDLDNLWNQFLVEKYQTQTGLLSAWGNPEVQSSPELMQDVGFESNNINDFWLMELHQSATATMSTSSDNPFAGNQCADIHVTNTSSEGWHLQFQQNGISIQKDSTYTVTFMARADQEASISMGVMQNSSPWDWYGGTDFNLSSEWESFSFTFNAPTTNTDDVRLFMTFDNEAHYYLDNFSFKQSFPLGLIDDEDLGQLNIGRIRYDTRFAYSKQRISDNSEFYMELQKAYYDEMADYLKNDLQVKAPLTGTNALGGVFESYSAENVDYIDDHAYWEHPIFPNEAWSSDDWYIDNKSMLASPNLGVIPQLFGGCQMENKPFMISEYNHPYPNIYQIEMLPIIAGYSAFHGADGIMFFEYNGGTDSWDEDKVLGYFELHRNNSIMSQFPIFAYAFRNGLIKEDPEPILIDYSKEWLFNLSQVDNTFRWGKYFPYDNKLALTHAIKTTGFDHSEVSFTTESVSSSPFISATQELNFDANNSLLHIQTDQFESLGGQLSNAANYAGNMTISNTNNFGLVSWLSLSSQPLNESNKSILTISSRLENTNMIWDGTNTIHGNWGNSPTEMESNVVDISLTIDADYITVYPLDNLGVASTGIDIYPSMDKFLVQIDQNATNTPWFGIEAHGVTPTDNPDLSTVAIYPNPVTDSFFIRAKSSISALQIFAISGLKIKSFQDLGVTAQIDVSDMSPGIYILELDTQNGKEWYKLIVE